MDLFSPGAGKKRGKTKKAKPVSVKPDSPKRSFFEVNEAFRVANRGHNMSAANFRKWKFEHGFNPEKKPGAGKAGAKGGGSAKATRRRPSY